MEDAEPHPAYAHTGCYVQTQLQEQRKEEGSDYAFIDEDAAHVEEQHVKEVKFWCLDGLDLDLSWWSGPPPTTFKHL